MDKKTFNINTVVNGPASGACLEEVLATTLESVQLDPQDIIDIITVASKQHSQFQKYFGSQRQFVNNPPSRHPPAQGFSSFGGFGLAGQGMGSRYNESARSPYYTTYKGKDHPEFFEQLFAQTEFQITYHDTVLTDSFKFVGVEGDQLTFLGRDKELVKIAGEVVFHQGRLEVSLECTKPVYLFRIQPTFASDLGLREAVQNNTLRLPGLTPVNPSTLTLMDHIRNHRWQDLVEGELVVRIDCPEQVYLMGPRGQDDGLHMQVMAIPVEITETEEGIQATPQMHLGILKLELVFLKRYKHQA